MSVTFSHKAPPVELFIELREKCGWGSISPELAERAIKNSHLWVSAMRGQEVIGFVRLIGDGALNFYVQDLIVKKTERGSGVGRELMTRLMDRCQQSLPSGATLGLMSVAGKESFYEAFGFKTRPTGRFGAGMTLSYGE